MAAGKAPGAVSGVNALHEASGVAVLPVRTAIASVVPAGVTPVQSVVAQSTGASASNTRDMNEPDAVYGVMRIQSTTTLPPSGVKSLAAIGRIGPAMVAACDATCTPSTK